MNREILFRGKLLIGSKKGEWTEGCLKIWPSKEMDILPDDTVRGIYGAVDPATVGQYTGLTDKNGKKIFEGDLLLIGDGKQPVLVQFINFSWECTSEAIGPYYRHCLEEKSSKYEVIGNIHDNPELLQEDSKCTS